MSHYRVLRTPLLGSIRDLFLSGEHHLTVVSPFMTLFGLQVLRQTLNRRGTVRPGLTVLTRVSVKSIGDGALDLDPLVDLCREHTDCRVSNLPGLHAKVYIADGCRAIVTSANLTRGGLVGNYEYGVLLLEPSAVKAVLADMRQYAELGVDLGVSDLAELAERARDLHLAMRQSQAALRKGRAWRDLSSKVEALRDDLLRKRVRSQSVNAVFANTIRYLLRQGPLGTEELEARVQAVHPDMCDESIDRIIDGVHFGKKWKHMVRNSQQFLKRKGEIEYKDSLWCISEKVGGPT